MTNESPIKNYAHMYEEVAARYWDTIDAANRQIIDYMKAISAFALFAYPATAIPSLFATRRDVERDAAASPARQQPSAEKSAVATPSPKSHSKRATRRTSRTVAAKASARSRTVAKKPSRRRAK